ncbi:NAD dependent DNA ligase subunit B [Bacillus phage vB_BcgM]|nr:NAD dependent DNA ligase subunit B [Bacillus phage vB_BcgM]
MTTVVHKRSAIKRGKPFRGVDVLAEMKFKWITTREADYAYRIISGKMLRKEIPKDGVGFDRKGAFKVDTPLNFFLENEFYEYV